MNSLTPSVKIELGKNFPEIVTFDVSMATLSHWRIGGRVAAWVAPRTKEELAQVRAWIALHQLPSMIIGNTTNLLFADEGVNAVAIQVNGNLAGVRVKGQEIIAKAGVFVPCLARKSMQHGLMGLEHTIGIPGTLGGLIYMNGGSQRKGIGETVKYVESIDQKGKLKRYTKKQLEFSYRKSIFQSKNEVIVEVGFNLQKGGDKLSIHKRMLDILRSRRQKFPRNKQNCGSVFISDPAMYEKYGPPGKIIEECGLKGLLKGGAQVSTKHANFIVNNGGASASDVLYLIDKVRSEVFRMTGYRMDVEARKVDSMGNVLEI